MAGHKCILLIIAAALAVSAQARSDPNCVYAQLESGLVCGRTLQADDGSWYASFRGVPYAKPPIGPLRFKELEPLEPWNGVYDARYEGPVCHQTDVFYIEIMRPQYMSEDCIHANIHVPLEALLHPSTVKDFTPPSPNDQYEATEQQGLPILVFIHGGGFGFGSGDTDLYGPEFLVTKKMIVITFNYRLNVVGFLSLNTAQVPGNAGLRDMVTLLRWVQRNARAFGGDPDNVTLGGQSAGAISAHLLTLSKATKGLFKRTIMMSGTATSNLYSPSPFFAKFIQSKFLQLLAINDTDPDLIYQQLVELPVEKLNEANSYLLDQFGLTTFVPTVETPFPGVTTILDDYPEILIAKGRGKDIPLLVGYTNVECETFRKRFVKFGLVQKSKENPIIIVPPKTLFAVQPSLLPDVAKKIDVRYYNGTINVDGFIKSCTDGFFEYPVWKLMQSRDKRDAAMYVYKFSYNSDDTVFKKVSDFPLKYYGAGHVDDMTYVFKVNSVLGAGPINNEDNDMKDYMLNIFDNFINCRQPDCDELWASANSNDLLYKDIYNPNTLKNQVKGISSYQKQMIKFFDSLTMVE